MNTFSRLTLFGAMMVASVIFAVPMAYAVSPLEMGNANTGEHCAEDCDFHAVSSTNLIDFVRHVPGSGEIVNFVCASEFNGEMDENGEAIIHNQVFTPVGGGTPNCGISILECRTGGVDAPWHMLAEETDPGSEHAVLELCIDFLLGGGASCRASGDLELEGDQNLDGTYRLTAHHSSPWVIESNVATPPAAQPTCNSLLANFEFEGEWNTEESNIEVNHL